MSSYITEVIHVEMSESVELDSFQQDSMVQFFDHIPSSLIPWINAQKVFWVATAPLSETGHVNVSPKGFEGTMNVVVDDAQGPDDKATGSNYVWYEDLTGSGIETISHIRENGRVTIMFTAFEGPPRIVRLFGTGKVYEFGTPEYDNFLPPERRQPGSRAVIWVDVYKVGSSCGFSIPFYTYKGPRMRLHTFALNKEQQDFDHSCQNHQPEGSINDTQELPINKGLRNYWKQKNRSSLDGLPGLLCAYISDKPLGDWRTRGVVFRPDDERLPANVLRSSLLEDVGKVLMGFGAGVVVTTFLFKLRG